MGIELALLGAGTAFSAFGQVRQAQQQAATLEANARLQRLQAQRMAQDAALEQRVGRAEARRRRRLAELQRGGARAAQAASGITLQGTPTDVLADMAAEAELNALSAEFQSDVRAQQIERGAANVRTQAAQLESRAGFARSAGFASAAGTLASGGFSLGQRAGLIPTGASLLRRQSGSGLQGRITPGTGFT